VEFDRTRNPPPSLPSPPFFFRNNEYNGRQQDVQAASSNGRTAWNRIFQPFENAQKFKPSTDFDRDTSGCILIAKSKGCLLTSVELFKKQEISKVYHMLAMGQIKAGNAALIILGRRAGP